MSIARASSTRRTGRRAASRLAVRFLALGALGSPLVQAQDVPELCASLYRDNGAVPGDGQCLALAVTAPTGLGNYQCTSNPTFIRTYCGGPPPAVEDDDPLPDFEGDGDDGGETGGNGNGGADGGTTGGTGGDDMSGNGTDTGADAGSDNGGLTDYEEIIGGGPTNGGGNGSGDPVVGDVGSDSEGSGGRCAGENPIPTPPPPIDYVASTVLGDYAHISTGINAANLIDSAVAARETGDTSRLYENVQGTLVPLLSMEGALTNAFEDFSGYVDTGIALPGSGIGGAGFTCR